MPNPGKQRATATPKRQSLMLKQPLFWGRIPVPEIDAKVYCGPLFRPEKQARIGARVFRGRASFSGSFGARERGPSYTWAHVQGTESMPRKEGCRDRPSISPCRFSVAVLLLFQGRPSAVGGQAPSPGHAHGSVVCSRPAPRRPISFIPRLCSRNNRLAHRGRP